MPEESTDLVPAPPQSFIESKIAHYRCQFIEQLCEQDEFRQALACAKDANIEPFLYDLMLPKYRRWTATQLAKKHEIKMERLIDIVRDYMHSKAMLALMSGIPKIAADMVQDARSTEVECPKCDGFGIIMKEGIPNRDCPRCKGSGAVRKVGDSDSRKLILETLGWTGKKGAPLIQQTFINANVESVIDDLERYETLEAKVEP